MKKELELGSKNPQGFAESLPPEIQEDLRKISLEIDSNAPNQNQP